MSKLSPESTTLKELRWIKIACMIIAFAIIVTVLKTLKAVFIPLTFSIFLAFMFAPVNRYLKTKNIPTPIILFFMASVLMVLLSILFFLLYIGISTFASEFPNYQTEIIRLISQGLTNLKIPAQEIENLLKYKLNILTLISQFSVDKIISSFMGNFVNLFSNILLVIFFTIFIVSDHNRFMEKLIKMIVKDTKMTSGILSNIEKQLITYLLNKSLINLASALLCGLVLSLIGNDFIILSILLIFAMGYIPEIGSVIAVLFPLIFCFFKFGFGWQFFACITLLILITNIFGNYLEPRIMGNRLNLSPIIILCSLVFWAWIWGPVGMFFAIPITSIMNIIFKEIDTFSNITDILSDDQGNNDQ